MNDAKSAVASLESEKQKLEQAVANAQKTLGNDHVKQEPNKKTTTSVADAQKIVTEVSHDYQSQVKAINDAVSVGEKVNSANDQLSTLIDKYNELAKEVGQKELDKNTSKSFENLSDNALNKQKADLQKQIAILQAQVDEKKANVLVNNAIENANKGIFTANAINVSVDYFERDSGKKVTEIAPYSGSGGTVKDLIDFNSKVSFSVDASKVKRGSSVAIFQEKTETNSNGWNKDNGSDLIQGASVYDSTNKLIGVIKKTPYSDSNIRTYYVVVENEPSQTNTVGLQNFVISKTGGSINYDMPASFFNGLTNGLKGTITYNQMDGKEIAKLNVNIPQANFKRTQVLPATYIQNASESESNFHRSANGAGAYVALSGMYHHVTGSMADADTDVESYAPTYKEATNSQSNYQFVQDLSVSTDGINPVLPSSNFSNVGDKGQLGIRVRWNPVSADNHTMSETIEARDTEAHLYAQADAHDWLSVPFLRVENGKNAEELQKILNETPTKTQGLISYTDDSMTHAIMVYNVTKDFLQKATYTGVSNTLKKSFYLASLSPEERKQAEANTLAFYSKGSAIDGLSRVDFWGALLLFTYPEKEYTIKNHAYTLNTSGDYKVDVSENYTNVPIVHLAQGQSGVIVHYIDGTTGKDMQVTDYSIGNPGQAQAIKPSEKLGWNITTDGAKYPSGVKTVESDTNVNYPSEGTWADYYIVYMPLDVKAIGGLYDKPTVTYSLNDVTVTPDTVNYHYDNFTPYA
ncbi:hypothetical protein, partial [Ligilactobacillus equi]|uniref:hypothetical protein n=1 Tax=Ligilactobacillus equi TaxID=137357 RepID=UPI000AEC5F91